MSNFSRTFRQTMTVARRDFVATVFTPTFLLFLFAPILMMSFGLVGGGAASTMASSGEARMRVVAIVPQPIGKSLAAVDGQLRTLFPERSDDRPPPLVIEAPGRDVPAQARALFNHEDYEAAAVLYGPLERPQILYSRGGNRAANYLAELAEQALRAEKAGSTARLSQAEKTAITREQVSYSDKGRVAFLGVFGLFFLTLMLSGQAVGTMAEERSNKVIEVLAAAVPLESVFLGKLIGMFGVALTFVFFWGTLLSNLTKVLPVSFAQAMADLGPAVGTPAFPLLFVAYFTMAYMLLGAVFLSIGAQASTQRELQMLSLPITIFQVGMFGFAAAAAASPDSWVATAAEIFPFSSPFAMIGRAANSPELWPHLLALGWQFLWVAVIVTLGARWFRRGVLNSGSPKFRLKALFGR